MSATTCAAVRDPAVSATCSPLMVMTAFAGIVNGPSFDRRTADRSASRATSTAGSLSARVRNRASTATRFGSWAIELGSCDDGRPARGEPASTDRGDEVFAGGFDEGLAQLPLALVVEVERRPGGHHEHRPDLQVDPVGQPHKRGLLLRDGLPGAVLVERRVVDAVGAVDEPVAGHDAERTRATRGAEGGTEAARVLEDRQAGEAGLRADLLGHLGERCPPVARERALGVELLVGVGLEDLEHVLQERLQVRDLLTEVVEAEAHRAHARGPGDVESEAAHGITRRR